MSKLADSAAFGRVPGVGLSWVRPALTLAFSVVPFWPLFWVAALAASFVASSVPAARSGSAAAVTIVRNLLQPQVPGVPG